MVSGEMKIQGGKYMAYICLECFEVYEDTIMKELEGEGYIDDKDRYPEHHTEKTNIIRKHFKGESEIELQQEIFENATEFLRWAEGLDIIEW